MSAAPEDAPVRARSWEAAWAEREALLTIARRRSASAADAEDAVSEAITRSAETPDVDHERMGPWLAAVTTRLCVDEARERARAPKRIAYQVQQGTTTEDHGEDVCDRAEASWLADHVAALPARQSRALELRAQGLEVSGIAEQMGISDKAAEGLLQRARTALREVLTSALGWIGLVVAALVGTTRRRATAGSSAALAAAASVSMVVAVLHLPAPPAEAEPGRAGPAAVAPVSDASDRAADERRPPTPVAAAPAAPQRPAPAVRAPAPADPAAAPPAPASPRRTVVPPQDVEVHGFFHKGGAVTYKETDEPFVDAMQRCLREGPVVSETYVGCRRSDDRG